jgi:tetratricopeptide (TPR) repeat protein
MPLPDLTIRTRPVVLFMLAVLVLASARPARAADKWIEIKTQNFTVVSNDREGDARDIAFQFEQFREAIRLAFPWAQVQLDRPVHVIAVKGEPSMKALAPQYWEMRGGTRPASVFMTTADAHRILVRLDVVTTDNALVNPYQSAYWSYAGLVLQASFHRGLPLWLTNGLASVLSNTMIEPKRVLFGRQVPWLRDMAVSSPRMPLSQLVNLSQESTYYRTQDTRRFFDAQAWSLAQYMFFGAKDQGAKLNQVSRLILGGTASQAAIEQVFGSLNALSDAVDIYLHQGIYSYVGMNVNFDRSPAKSPVRVLDAAEAAATQAAFHVAMGRGNEARALLAEARKGDPALALSDDAEAILLDREQKADEARTAFAKAAAAGSKNFWVHYRLANLSFTPGPPNPEMARTVAGHLEQATALNPTYAPAFAFLGSMRVQLNETEKALEAGQRAVALKPDDVQSRLVVANALLQMGRQQDAVQAARDAASYARTPQDQRSIDSFLQFAARSGRGN